MWISIAGGAPVHPLCKQLYNLFYTAHPSALRIEPLLNPAFTNIAPASIPRCHKSSHDDTVVSYDIGL